MFEEKIVSWAQKKGYQVGTGRVDLLKKVVKNLQQRKKNKEIDPDFFKEYLSCFESSKDFKLDATKSLILVAVPRPAHIMSFEREGDIIKMILPPTYVNYRGLFEEVRRDLESKVFLGQVRIKTLNVPLKALACELGLVSYGKNNLTYNPEFGSFFQLLGYQINAPLVEIKLQNSGVGGMMPECAKCKACGNACPLGAIDQNRFLLHAERCYTLYSESIHPIPETIHPPSLMCIIGCLKCQEVCPMNKGRLKYEDSDVVFSSQETSAILDPHNMSPGLKRSIEGKFNSLGLSEDTDVFFRNFRKILKIQK